MDYELYDGNYEYEDGKYLDSGDLSVDEWELDEWEAMYEGEDDQPESDYYEDWDNLEMGFDPYMGCYSDDC